MQIKQRQELTRHLLLSKPRRAAMPKRGDRFISRFFKDQRGEYHTCTITCVRNGNVYYTAGNDRYQVPVAYFREDLLSGGGQPRRRTMSTSTIVYKNVEILARTFRCESCENHYICGVCPRFCPVCGVQFKQWHDASIDKLAEPNRRWEKGDP